MSSSRNQKQQKSNHLDHQKQQQESQPFQYQHNCNQKQECLQSSSSILDKEDQFQPPKGTKDTLPEQMLIKKHIVNEIRKIFDLHGFMEIETPMFELKSTLLNKYGEESKLIYDLKDQGGQQLSLRYDLTVPFARFLQNNNIREMKRYQIGPVYRRDQPSFHRGRFREFYQCDADIAGKYDIGYPDAEIIIVMQKILEKINLTQFSVHVSHRSILEGFLMMVGIPQEKLKSVCSSIDKLDKSSIEDVKDDLIQQKGISIEATEKIAHFISLNGEPFTILKSLSENYDMLMVDENSKKGFIELEKIFSYMKKMGYLKNVVMDLSLARGLDYYTGMIFEIVLKGSDVASVCGGGRYDNLIGSLGKNLIPAVGGSLGLDRIIAYIESKRQLNASLSKKNHKRKVLIGQIGKGEEIITRKLKLVSQLWLNNICAEYLYYDQIKPRQQLEYALKQNIPLIIWVGEDEIKNNIFKVKNLALQKQEDVHEDQLLEYIKQFFEQNKVIN